MTEMLRVQTVSDVVRATRPLDEIPMRVGIERLLHGPIESCSDFAKSVVGRTDRVSSESDKRNLSDFERRMLESQTGLIHPFIGAIHQCYVDHRPLTVSPDMFWLLITQGLAVHINNNPDEYREQLRGGMIEKTITVRNDSLCKGALENPWQDVFSQFSSQIRQRIGEQNYAAIVAEFSTTGPAEQAAAEIVLMGMVKSYFNFGLRTLCGIPEIVLEGTAGDWMDLRNRAAALGTLFHIEWWTNSLVEILDQVAANASGDDIPDLWQTLYKRYDESGGPFLSGWILKFFPYLGRGIPTSRNPHFLDKAEQQRRVVPWVVDRDKEMRRSTNTSAAKKLGTPIFGITSEMLPSGLSRVPFEWKYLHKVYPMEFVAGFTGFTQEVESLRLRPKIGWAVRDATAR